ncbi:PREDICTED: keratin, type I cytoskeletal 9-like [Tinamus guttatus]|uniref:keratin, type I cytoskeletal 9-like n=1 Tax=Tinamus guttatus TaxID=94827 RepID=UPI00052F2AE8|nr:PREDICTED: keratin, type I cytoskeletal 9-like [Tinamus guttatus]
MEQNIQKQQRLLYPWDVFLFQIYRWLRGRCPRRRRGYRHEISSHYGTGYCSRGGVSSLRGHGSFFCDGEGSITYSRASSPCRFMPSSSTFVAGGEYRCAGDGCVVITRGDSGGSSAWGMARGSVCDTEGGPRYSIEDLGSAVSSGAGGASSYGGSWGYGTGRDSGYGYEMSSRDKCITAGEGGGGSGYCGGPEIISGGSGCSQSMQQKCPVVVPEIKSDQTKQECQWPLSQKK